MTARSITSAVCRAAERTAGSGWWRSWPAQEFQCVFGGRNRSTTPGVVSFEFTKSSRRVGDVLLLHLGPRFRGRVHQDLHLLSVSGQGVGQRARVGQMPSRSCRDRVHGVGQRVRDLRRPRARLQQICDRFGPADVQGFFDRWTRTIPTPFTASRSCRGVLVGAVDAPSRGVTHDGVR